MADSGWVVLGSVAAGVIGKGLWDVWLARGKVKADQEARDEVHRNRQAERAADLQRETLLAAQEAAVDLIRHTAEIHRYQLTVPNLLSSSYVLPDELGAPYKKVHAQIRLYYSRMVDEEARTALGKLQGTCAIAVRPSEFANSKKAMNNIIQPFDAFQDRAGYLLRHMDYA